MGIIVLSVALILSGVAMLLYVRGTNIEIRRLQARYKKCLAAYERQFWELHQGESYVPHERWEEMPRNPIEEREKTMLADMYEDTLRQGERELMLKLWNTTMEKYYTHMNNKNEKAAADVLGTRFFEDVGKVYNIANK